MKTWRSESEKKKYSKYRYYNFEIDFNLLTDFDLNCHSLLYKTLIIFTQFENVVYLMLEKRNEHIHSLHRVFK